MVHCLLKCYTDTRLNLFQFTLEPHGSQGRGVLFCEIGADAQFYEPEVKFESSQMRGIEYSFKGI